VDTGSTDGTRELAAKMGARVFEFPWVDDFAAGRNECIRHATGDFIFWMDADESIDISNREKLRLLFNSLPRRGDTETGRHGEKNDTGTRGRGDTGTGRHRDTETGRQGDAGTGRQGDPTAGRPLTTNHSPLTNIAYVMKCLSVQPGETQHGTVVDH